MAIFTSQAEAKRFFINRVLAEARAERQPLSEAEAGMLSFSASEPDLAGHEALVARPGAEISDSEYEAKIVRLLRRAHEDDVASRDDTANEWRDAHRVLSQGDHYLLVMIDQAIGAAPWSGNGPLRVAAKAGLFLFVAVPGIIALLMAAGVAVTIGAMVWLEPVRRLAAVGPLALVLVLLTSGGIYLIRLWRRENRR